MADEKARLRKRMRELEAELGGLRRTVMGKPSPLPAVGTVLPGVVEGYGQAGCFATLETFGAGFIHMSEMSRRIVITQRRGAADETVGALLPAVEQASWPQHVVLANLTPEFVLPIGTKVWAQVIEPLYVGQLRLSLANVDQETGHPLPPEPPMPDLGAIIRGIVCHSESYGDLLLLPGYREAGAERNCRQALLHRSMQPKSQHGKLQVGQADFVVFTQGQGPFEHVFEFAYITGECMLIERSARIGRYAGSIDAEFVGLQDHEVVSQQCNIVATLTQRCNRKFDDIDAVVEVLSEITAFH